MTDEELYEVKKRIQEAPDTERFSFADPLEMAAYIKHCKAVGKRNGVIWTNSKEYFDRFKRGLALFDEGRYERALDAYREAIEVNPVAIAAKFEISECCLHLGKLSEAEKTLLDMQEYLAKAKDIARFYRRISYIAVERENYRLAVACLLFSRGFERSDYVTNELMYILHVAGVIAVPDPQQVIQDAGLPILEAKDKGREQTSV